MINKSSNQLKITKPNGKTHLAPLGQLKHIMHQNSLLKDAKKYAIDEVDPDGKIVKNHFKSETASVVSQKDARIAELEKELAEAKNNSQGEKPLTAEEVIAKINNCTTPEQVTELVKDEQRKSVIAAANKKIAELGK